jgi:HEPN domain-containing protein
MKLTSEAQGHRWLMQAEADRHGGQLLFDGESYHLACFIAQQVAEKALKAYLYAQGEEIVLGHSVEALARRCAEYDTEFIDLRDEIASLDAYYIPTRYPNGLPESIPARVYTRSAAKETLRMADQALSFVKARLRSAG